MRINKNRKSIISMLVIMAISLSVFSVGTSVYAADDPACANSNICAAPALGFKLATSFVREMITAIKTVGTNPPYLGNYVSPSRFQAGEFVPPKEGLVGKFIRNIRQKLNTILAVGAVFTDIRNFGGIKDFAGGFIVLFKNKVFLRDYKTLADLDSLVNDKTYELGLGGGWAEELNEANLKMFQDILKKYVDQGLFTDASISDDVTYRQIIMLMARVNRSLKTFIASPGFKIPKVFKGFSSFTYQFKTEFTKEKLFSDSPEISLEFNPVMISNMDDEYDCARGLTKCDDTLSKFVSNISKIGKTFGSGTVDVGKTIADASKRLAAALGFGSKENKAAAQKRQQELLKSQFGLQSQTAASGILGIASYREQLQSAGKKIKSFKDEITKELVTENQWAALFSGVNMSQKERKKITDDIAKQMEDLKKTNAGQKISNKDVVFESLVYHCINSSQTVDASFYTGLRASMNALYAEASEESKSMVIANNTDVTSVFYSVFTAMRNTIDNVIGSSAKDDSLIKNLGDACKAQCANVGGKCFY